MALVNNPLLPTNTLEAVNIILGYMREPPIDDITLVNTSFAVELSYRSLMLASRTFQTRGWYFNQYDRTYTPLADGTLTLPEGIISATASEDYQRSYDGPKPIMRGSRKIIDRVTGRADIWKSQMTFTVTEVLDFEDLPETAKLVITLNAATLVGEQTGEGVELSPYHQQAIMSANATLVEEDLDARRVNFFTTLDNRR